MMKLKKIHLHRDTDFTNLLNKGYYESDEVDEKIKELEEGEVTCPVCMSRFRKIDVEEVD